MGMSREMRVHALALMYSSWHKYESDISASTWRMSPQTIIGNAQNAVVGDHKHFLHMCDRVFVGANTRECIRGMSMLGCEA